MAETAPAEIGHNEPPDAIEELRIRLADDNREWLDRATALAEAFERVPETVEDDETAGKVADFIKQLTGVRKALETARVSEKEPFLESGRAVDGFFKKVIEPLDKAKKAVESRLTIYQRNKADEERRRREEEERRAKEEAERAAAEAAERAAALESDDDLDAAIEAEEAAKRKADEAAKAEREADAKAADLSRSRGDLGSVASLRTNWTFEVLDVHQIPLEQIRPYLPISAVEQAIRGFVKAGGRELEGVRIFEDTHTVVR